MPTDAILECDDKVRVAILWQGTIDGVLPAVGFLKKAAGALGDAFDDGLGRFTAGCLGQLHEFENEGLQKSNRR